MSKCKQKTDIKAIIDLFMYIISCAILFIEQYFFGAFMTLLLAVGCSEHVKLVFDLLIKIIMLLVIVEISAY